MTSHTVYPLMPRFLQEHSLNYNSKNFDELLRYLFRIVELTNRESYAQNKVRHARSIISGTEMIDNRYDYVQGPLSYSLNLNIGEIDKARERLRDKNGTTGHIKPDLIYERDEQFKKIIDGLLRGIWGMIDNDDGNLM